MKRLSIVAIAAAVIIVLAVAAMIYIPQSRPRQSPGVEIVCHNGTVIRLQVEIADSPEERARGLMNRTSLARDAGMLFVFESDWPWSFWMYNTLIPLDMIFIAHNETIVDIHENAKPLSLDKIVPSGHCRYVLEVNGGLCKAYGLRVGDRVRLDID